LGRIGVLDYIARGSSIACEGETNDFNFLDRSDVRPKESMHKRVPPP